PRLKGAGRSGLAFHVKGSCRDSLERLEGALPFPEGPPETAGLMTGPEGRAGRVSRNTLFLYFSEGLGRLFSWATVAYLTRHWGDVGTYGQYAVAVNWISIFGVFSELGLNVLVVREVSRRKDR